MLACQVQVSGAREAAMKPFTPFIRYGVLAAALAISPAFAQSGSGAGGSGASQPGSTGSSATGTSQPGGAANGGVTQPGGGMGSSPGATQGEPREYRGTDGDRGSDHNFGWVGLLGLAGLTGLIRRDNRAGDHTPTPRV
jgi:MYXO-CTERM domain-containing protein